MTNLKFQKFNKIKLYNYIFVLKKNIIHFKLKLILIINNWWVDYFISVNINIMFSCDTSYWKIIRYIIIIKIWRINKGSTYILLSHVDLVEELFLQGFVSITIEKFKVSAIFIKVFTTDK